MCAPIAFMILCALMLYRRDAPSLLRTNFAAPLAGVTIAGTSVAPSSGATNLTPDNRRRPSRCSMNMAGNVNPRPDRSTVLQKLQSAAGGGAGRPWYQGDKRQGRRKRKCHAGLWDVNRPKPACLRADTNLDRVVP